MWKTRSTDSFNEREGRTLTHIANAWNAAWAGKPAFTAKAKNGYLKGAINGGNFYAHRVIWKLVHGSEPDDIDHDDGDRSNNRLINLFDRSRWDNLKNRKISKNNTSGTLGVSYSTRHSLWQAVIYHNKKPIHLGWFKLKEDAVRARKDAETVYTYHPNHGVRT